MIDLTKTARHLCAALSVLAVGCAGETKTESAFIPHDEPVAVESFDVAPEIIEAEPSIELPPAGLADEPATSSRMRSRAVESAAPMAAARPVEKTAQSNNAIVRVFYGTNRRPSGDLSNPNTAYTSKIGSLQLGVAAVSIPPTHTYGELERPSIWRLEFREDVDKHVALRQVQPVSQDRFVAALQTVTGQSERREAFVFVHGFNNDFAEAARRTAQMKHDLDFDGPAILFSWPSVGEFYKYGRDRKAIEATVPELTKFLGLVAEQSGAERVYLIAHSMGNEFATRSLAALTSAGHRDLYDEVILAAPDVDATEFATTIAPALSPACRRCTIYAADHDVALSVSRRINKKRRLGQAGAYLTTFPHLPYINVVDASAVDFDAFNLGHADFADDLLSDIRAVMDGVDPVGRHLQPHRQQAAWTFTPAAKVEQTSFETITAIGPSSPSPRAKPVGFWASVRSYLPF